MEIRTFEGNFHEIGREMGRIHTANGMSTARIKVDPVLYKNQLKVYQEHYPELLEELQGVAEGGDFDRDKLIYSAITGEIFFFKNMLGMGRACTIFGYKSKDDLFVGRNYDWLPVSSDLFEVYKVRNPSRNAYFAVTDYGIVDPGKIGPSHRAFLPEDAINDKGLFVGLTFSFADQWSYGISSIHIVKLMRKLAARLPTLWSCSKEFRPAAPSVTSSPTGRAIWSRWNMIPGNSRWCIPKTIC